MFAFLSIVLALALFRFGAVEPETWFGIAVLFALGFLVLTVSNLWTRREIDLRFLALAGGCAVLAVFVDVKLALAPMAGTAAWLAVSRRPGALVRFFHVLLVVGVLEALLGLFQYFVAPGWILGYVSDAYATSGTLINRNHFAGLLGMLIPVAIGLAYVSWVRFRDPGRTYFYLLIGSVMGLALAFSVSRMGIASFVVTLGLLSILIRWSRSGRLGSVVALVPLFMVLGGAAWIGVDVIVERFEQLVGPDGAISDARFPVFESTLEMIADHPLGIGVGEYEDRFRQYQTYRNDLLFDHAHNDYLETAAEWGIPVAAAVWAWIFFVFGSAVRAFLKSRDPEQEGVLLAAIGAIFAILIHSLVDFNLQIPSNAMLFAIFIGIAVAATGRVKTARQFGRVVPAKRYDAGAVVDSRPGKWQVRPEAAWQNSLVLALSAAIAAAVFISASGPFMGAWITRADTVDPAVYERALEYDPGNADYHFILAQIHHSSTPYLDPERALVHYLAAVEANPDRSRHWLGLARFYEDQGDAAGARRAMGRALESDPNDAQTYWAAANLYVRLGDTGDGDRALRRAAELDPRYTQQVLDLVWRFYGDPDRIMTDHVPHTRDANLVALRYFVGQESEAGAELAWERLSEFDTEVRERLSYVNFLVDRGRPSDAYGIFLGSTAGPEASEDFFNGDFERETLNGGFDWRYGTGGPAEVRRDTTQSHDGFASLRIQFPGEENVTYSHVSHWLALERGRPYRMTFWMRTEGITTDQGVYVEVDGERSEAVLGTTFWQEFEVPFVASSDLVTVRVRRNASQRFDNALAGRVWLDGFEIHPAEGR